MAGYGCVRDKNGGVCGFWFSSLDTLEEEKKRGGSPNMGLRTLCIKHNASEEIYGYFYHGDYRIVPNNFDNNGGYFIMADNYPAPGE